ncbi:MAG: methenyltetrahydromethanopterin cyclohydrolase, partial [Methanosarcinales archaeon]|nr:methenyltetrahydromethanopterin cyclohydrolase [Methanosarcinales archaeon]
MISINEQTVEIVEEMMTWEEELKVKTHTLDNGATVIDCGVNVDGSIEAGLMFTEVCMGGLATTSVSVHKIGDTPFPFIDVTTDHPSIACLAAQKAGWSVSVGDYFAMGSGPARALALKPKHTYEKINYED